HLDTRRRLRPTLQAVGGELQDHAGPRLRARDAAAELGVVNAAISTIDDDILAVCNLVDEADADDASDHPDLPVAALENGHHAGLPLDAGGLQGALHHFELVGPVAELP